MEARQLLRAVSVPRSLGFTGRIARPTTTTAPCPAAALCQQQKRTKLTANRTKRALNIPPHPSFLNADAAASTENVVIYNPPSSEASVLHTPFKFLPKSDPRRRSNLAALFESSATIRYPSPAAADGPDGEETAGMVPPQDLPKVKLPEPAPRAVTADDVAEMMRLRAEDERRWTVVALAKRYGCTKSFVMAATGSKKMTPHKELMAKRLQTVKERWGPHKTRARADRAKRREMLYRGEL